MFLGNSFCGNGLNLEHSQTFLRTKICTNKVDVPENDVGPRALLNP